MRQIRFTKDGYEKLKKEKEDLLLQRPDAVLDLKKAREMGDLSENGYYKSARFKLSSIDRRLRIIAATLKQAVLIDSTKNGVVNIGSLVTLLNDGKETNYTIVGDFEADPNQKKISLMSPLGKALEGKKIGDTVNIYTPSGKTTYRIINIF